MDGDGQLEPPLPPTPPTQDTKKKLDLFRRYDETVYCFGMPLLVMHTANEIMLPIKYHTIHAGPDGGTDMRKGDSKSGVTIFLLTCLLKCLALLKEISLRQPIFILKFSA